MDTYWIRRRRISQLGFQTQLAIWGLLVVAEVLEFTLPGNYPWLVLGVYLAVIVGMTIRQFVLTRSGRLQAYADRKLEALR